MYYADFFHLKEAPFSIAPNPRYLFMSERHREALAHLLYGVVNGNGFVALTGEVGTGKTTLCNCLLDQLPDHIDLALVLNPRVDAVELLATVCDELEIAYPEGTRSLKVLLDRLNAHLLKVHARGRNTVLLIDEAQNLSSDVLEQVRLLTNLETQDTKLLQIILVGQPELNQKLAQKNLRQLNQRITARYHIDPLSLSDCHAYLEHRLKVAGAGYSVFTKRAIKRVYRFSGGIPRLINILCDRALLGAYSLGTHHVGPKIVDQAAREVLLSTTPRPPWRTRRIGLGLGIPIVILAAFVFTRPFFRAVADRPGPESPRAGTHRGIEHSRLGEESPIFDEMFGDLLRAARAGLNWPPLSRPAPLRAATSSKNPAPSVAEKTASDRNPRSSASTDATEGKAVSREQPSESRFIDRISNPDLNLYAVLPQLFRQWNIDGEPSTHNLCQAARRSGLRCLVQHGTWNYLIGLNRPATLEFSLQKGVTRYATLIRVDDETATFRFLNEDSFSFPIAEVLPFWQGQFALLWKPPAPDTALLTRGHSNSSVSWLRKTLAKARGTLPENPESIFFDQALEEQVIAFQTEHGLDPDGKVGSETIILLNTLSDSPEIPKLLEIQD